MPLLVNTLHTKSLKVSLFYLLALIVFYLVALCSSSCSLTGKERCFGIKGGRRSGGGRKGGRQETGKWWKGRKGDDRLESIDDVAGVEEEDVGDAVDEDAD